MSALAWPGRSSHRTPRQPPRRCHPARRLLSDIRRIFFFSVSPRRPDPRRACWPICPRTTRDKACCGWWTTTTSSTACAASRWRCCTLFYREALFPRPACRPCAHARGLTGTRLRPAGSSPYRRPYSSSSVGAISHRMAYPGADHFSSLSLGDLVARPLKAAIAARVIALFNNAARGEKPVPRRTTACSVRDPSLGGCMAT